MPDDPLEEMAKVSAADSRGGLDRRLERERRVQGRARRVRQACRWIVVTGGILSLGGMFAGAWLEYSLISGLGCTLLLPTLIAGVVLFFMGGMAPGRVRHVLSESQRKRLDE